MENDLNETLDKNYERMKDLDTGYGNRVSSFIMSLGANFVEVLNQKMIEISDEISFNVVTTSCIKNKKIYVFDYRRIPYFAELRHDNSGRCVRFFPSPIDNTVFIGIYEKSPNIVEAKSSYSRKTCVVEELCIPVSNCFVPSFIMDLGEFLIHGMVQSNFGCQTRATNFN